MFKAFLTKRYFFSLLVDSHYIQLLSPWHAGKVTMYDLGDVLFLMHVVLSGKESTVHVTCDIVVPQNWLLETSSRYIPKGREEKSGVPESWLLPSHRYCRYRGRYESLGVPVSWFPRRSSVCR